MPMLMERWRPPTLPKDWALVEVTTVWGHGVTQLRIELRHLPTSTRALAVLRGADDWAWVERVLLPALASLEPAPRFMDWEAKS